MRLFISYAHSDRQKVSELVDVLREAAYDPWFDHRLMPGQNWKAELLNAIRSCEAFVYALTPDSARSEWCQWEFSEAVKMGKPVIPVLLQAHTPLPDAISQYQYADFTEGPTPRAVARLMGGLRIMALVVPPEVVPPAPDDPVGRPAQAYGQADEPILDDESLPSAHPRIAVEISPDDYTPLDESLADSGLDGSEPETPPTWSVNFSLKRAITDILPPPFEWCRVPKGRVTLSGLNGQSPERGETYIVGAFQISRYPITNAQYQVFVRAADGYGQERWWDYSDAARQSRSAHPQPQDTGFAGRDLPRTNVSWFDAMAFCFWLNWKVGLSPKALPYTGKGVITLPSEQQWQRAAQGDDSRIYPWGRDMPDQTHANFGSSVNRPSSVTQHPEDASLFGVCEMSGNVWEWCLTTYDGNAVELRRAAGRVLRGGAWNSPPEELTVMARTQAEPYTTSDTIGFRIAHAITGAGE